MQQLHPLRPHLERLYPLGDVVAHGVIDDDDGGRARAPASGRGAFVGLCCLARERGVSCSARSRLCGRPPVGSGTIHELVIRYYIGGLK